MKWTEQALIDADYYDDRVKMSTLYRSSIFRNGDVPEKSNYGLDEVRLALLDVENIETYEEAKLYIDKRNKDLRTKKLATIDKSKHKQSGEQKFMNNARKLKKNAKYKISDDLQGANLQRRKLDLLKKATKGGNKIDWNVLCHFSNSVYRMRNFNDLSKKQKGYFFEYLDLFLALVEIRGFAFLYDTGIRHSASVDVWFHFLLFISDVDENSKGCRLRSNAKSRPTFKSGNFQIQAEIFVSMLSPMNVPDVNNVELIYGVRYQASHTGCGKRGNGKCLHTSHVQRQTIQENVMAELE